MQLQPYLMIYNNFGNLPRSEFYMQAIDNVNAILKFPKDLLNDFQSMEKLRIEYIMEHFIFCLNMISETTKFAFYLIHSDDDDDKINTIQLFSIN